MASASARQRAAHDLVIVATQRVARHVAQRRICQHRLGGRRHRRPVVHAQADDPQRAGLAARRGGCAACRGAPCSPSRRGCPRASHCCSQASSCGRSTPVTPASAKPSALCQLQQILACQRCGHRAASILKAHMTLPSELYSAAQVRQLEAAAIAARHARLHADAARRRGGLMRCCACAGPQRPRRGGRGGRATTVAMAWCWRDWRSRRAWQ